MAIATDAITPAVLAARRPAHRSTTAPASGAAGISQTKCTRLPPHDREVVHVRAVTTAEDEDDDRQTDGNLGSCNDDHEEDYHLSADGAVQPGERDEGDVDGV